LETNQKIGNYIYIGYPIEIGLYSNTKIQLKCKCGKVVSTRISSITSGKSKTCGKCSRFILKNGYRSGNLVYVGDDIGIQKESQKKIKFRCDCGKEKEIRIFTVMRGMAKTCGNCNQIILKPGDKLGIFTYSGKFTINIHLRSSKKILLTCNNGHIKLISIRIAEHSSCSECNILVLNPGDTYGTFKY